MHPRHTARDDRPARPGLDEPDPHTISPPPAVLIVRGQSRRWRAADRPHDQFDAAVPIVRDEPRPTGVDAARTHALTCGPLIRPAARRRRPHRPGRAIVTEPTVHRRSDRRAAPVAGRTGSVRSPDPVPGPPRRRPTSPSSAAGRPAARSPGPAPRAACAPPWSTRPRTGRGGSPTAPSPPSCPRDLPATAVAARARGRAVALTERDLGWEYTRARRAGAACAPRRRPRPGVTVVAGRAVHRDADGVALADGTHAARARVVVDAGGHRQPLRDRPVAPGRRPSRPPTAWSWTRHRGARRRARRGAVHGLERSPRRRVTGAGDGWPTFLYAVPLGAGRVLLEETSLARRPGPADGPAATTGCPPGWPGTASRRPPDGRGRAVHFPVETRPPPRRRRARLRCRGTAGAPGQRVQRRHGPAAGPRRRGRARRAPARRPARRRSPRHARWSGRPPPRRCTCCAAAGWRRCCGCPPTEVPAFFEVFFGLPGAPPVGLPHRPRRPPGDGRRHERAVRPGRVGAASARLVGPALRPALRANAPAPTP